MTLYESHPLQRDPACCSGMGPVFRHWASIFLDTCAGRASIYAVEFFVDVLLDRRSRGRELQALALRQVVEAVPESVTSIKLTGASWRHALPTCKGPLLFAPTLRHIYLDSPGSLAWLAQVFLPCLDTVVIGSSTDSEHALARLEPDANLLHLTHLQTLVLQSDFRSLAMLLKAVHLLPPSVKHLRCTLESGSRTLHGGMDLALHWPLTQASVFHLTVLSHFARPRPGSLAPPYGYALPVTHLRLLASPLQPRWAAQDVKALLQEDVFTACANFIKSGTLREVVFSGYGKGEDVVERVPCTHEGALKWSMASRGGDALIRYLLPGRGGS
jgi:hypothetical protein